LPCKLQRRERATNNHSLRADVSYLFYLAGTWNSPHKSSRNSLIAMSSPIQYYRRKHDNLSGSEKNIFWSKNVIFFDIFPKTRKSTTFGSPKRPQLLNSSTDFNNFCTKISHFVCTVILNNKQIVEVIIAEKKTI
jgi:hypothetical protein